MAVAAKHGHCNGRRSNEESMGCFVLFACGGEKRLRGLEYYYSIPVLTFGFVELEAPVTS